jgi:purine-binding chemotaxis protein CheW
MELGLMVDSVSEVIDIAGTDIEAPPQFGTTIQRDFIQGLGKVDGEFVVILDTGRALNVDDMALIAEQAQTH